MGWRDRQIPARRPIVEKCPIERWNRAVVAGNEAAMGRFDPELIASRWWPRASHQRTFLVNGKNADPSECGRREQEVAIPPPSTLSLSLEQFTRNALNSKRM